MADKFHFDPRVDLKNYREAMRHMLEGGWMLPRDLMPSPMNAVVIPVDLLDNGTEIVLKANLPGVKPEDVTIRVVDGRLTIEASLGEEEDIRGATYLHHERRATAFVRSIKLPVAVEADRAEARYKQGVLTLILPKSAAVRPHNIKVSAG